MRPVIEILLINAASASLLALAVVPIRRVVKRPAVLHVLWLLVLLKLLTPPVLEIAALPRLETLIAAESAAEPIPLELLTALPPAAFEAASPGPLATAPFALWFGGSGLLLSLVVLRVARFRKLLADAPPVDVRIREEAARIARAIGLSFCPRVRLIGGRVPPMVWWCLGRCDLLLPAGLVGRLHPAERETLIAHELAHVRRRDPWVRYVEILATVLFWWHPVVWWARRNLRLNEERSCDALVLEAMPGQTRAYARGLIKTLDFLSVREPIVPAVATGAVGTRQLEERLTMIVKGTTPRKTTPAQRFLLATLVAGALLIFPTWIDRAAADERTLSPREERYRAELLDLEVEANELARRMREVDAARMELHAALREERTQAELAKMEAHAQQAEASGQRAEAEKLRRAAEDMARRRQLEAERLETKLDLMRRTSELEGNLAEITVEIERAKADGDLTRAEELAARAADLQLDLGSARFGPDPRHDARAEAEMAAELDALRAKAEAARYGGDPETARKLEAMIEQRTDEMQRHNVFVELQPIHEDHALHEEALRARERALQRKLEQLEQRKLETEEELHSGEERRDQLRRELDERLPRD